MNDQYEQNVEIVDFEDLVLPETLYKYRDWSKENNREIISKKEVFFAPPSSFVDPFDCKIRKRWDLLTYNDILNMYYHDSLTHNKHFSKYEHIEHAVDWANNTAITHPEFVESLQQKQFIEYSQRTGVLSLTEYPNSIPMWDMYSGNNTGFCVGFDPTIMLKDIGGGGGKVMYHDELPIIYPAPKHSFSLQANLQVFSKLFEWCFEQEYRTYKFRPEPLQREDRLIKLPAEAYREIILGASMSPENMNSLIDSIPADLGHIAINKAYIENGVIIIQPYDK